ncbi:hypothetical protein WME76_20515 [Sorangium sp. So ce119]|uniref:hypothetical protein n=1 Tax=Sorangium sp. So ce119 TaxID=3133279 RepID=UPI003F5DF7B0
MTGSGARDAEIEQPSSRASSGDLPRRTEPRRCQGGDEKGSDSGTLASCFARGTRVVTPRGFRRELSVTAHRPAPSAGRVDIFNLTIDGPERNYLAEGLLVHDRSEA